MLMQHTIKVEKTNKWKKWAVMVDGVIISEHCFESDANKLKDVLVFYSEVYMDTDVNPKPEQKTEPCYNPLLHGSIDINEGSIIRETTFVKVHKVKVDVCESYNLYAPYTQYVHYTTEDYPDVWNVLYTNMLTNEEAKCTLAGDINRQRSAVAMANKIIRDGGIYITTERPKVITLNSAPNNEISI